MGAERRRRLLLLGLAAIIAGMTCGAASVALMTAWLVTGDHGLMTVSGWLTWCAYGCLTVAVACAALLWRSR
jgi:hypothetical protein